MVRRRLRGTLQNEGLTATFGNSMLERNPEFPNVGALRCARILQERAQDTVGYVLHGGAHAAAEAEVVTRALDKKERHGSRNQSHGGLDLRWRAERVLGPADEK